MKHLKRFMALIIALCFGILSTATVFAAEDYDGSNIVESKVDYLNYDFPDDAKIIYHGEDGVMYQTHEESSVASTQSTRSTEYNGVWIDKGKNPMGSFSIKNPHTLINTTEGTFKIESNYSGASAEMILIGGASVLADKTLSVSDGDVRFSFKSNSQNLTIKYYVHSYSNTYGMRLMCWLW